MILIADSGSTKCDWAQCLTDGKIVKIHQTVGFNPKYTSHKNLQHVLENSTMNEIKEKINEIHFFGAGCSSVNKNNTLKNHLASFFKSAKITVKHDLEAAVKASYRGAPIICSILGTGSNSCFYDGKTIIENAPSLGYILGDEASGNYFGKKLINLYINKKLPNHIKEHLENWTDDREKEIIDNIYSLEKPNLYIASFFCFIHENRHESIFDQMLKDGIKHFFDLHIKCFDDYAKYPLTFVGSVAFYLSDYIHKIMAKENMKVESIIQSPIYNLVNVHFKLYK